MVKTCSINTTVNSSTILKEGCIDVDSKYYCSNDRHNCKLLSYKKKYSNCYIDEIEIQSKTAKEKVKQIERKVLIDTSTPEALERDFYAWLRGTKYDKIKEKTGGYEKNENDMFSLQSMQIKTESFTADELTKTDKFSLLPLHSVKPSNSESTDSANYNNLIKESAVGSFFLRSSSSLSSCSSSASSTGSLATNASFNDFTTYNCIYDCFAFWNDGNNYTIPIAETPVVEKNFVDVLAPYVYDPVKHPAVSKQCMNKSVSDGDIPSTTVLLNKSKNCPKICEDTTQMLNNKVNLHSRSSGTNQLGRQYSPGLPLSMSERECIVELYRNGWKICDISKRLCVTHSCVSKILHRFRTTGSCRPKDAKEGRQESPLVAAIRDYRFRLGMTRQSEIREQLIRDSVCKRENAPSRSSINHILRTKLDLKRRKK